MRIFIWSGDGILFNIPIVQCIPGKSPLLRLLKSPYYLAQLPYAPCMIYVYIYIHTYTYIYMCMLLKHMIIYIYILYIYLHLGHFPEISMLTTITWSNMEHIGICFHYSIHPKCFLLYCYVICPCYIMLYHDMGIEIQGPRGCKTDHFWYYTTILFTFDFGYSLLTRMETRIKPLNWAVRPCWDTYIYLP